MEINTGHHQVMNIKHWYGWMQNINHISLNSKVVLLILRVSRTGTLGILYKYSKMLDSTKYFSYTSVKIIFVEVGSFNCT